MITGEGPIRASSASGATVSYRQRKFSYAKEAYYILCFIAALFIFLFGIFGPGGYLEWKQTAEQLRVQRARVEGIRRTIQGKMQTIDGLKNDPAAIEEYLRREGYVLPGEYVQEYPPGPAPSRR